MMESKVPKEQINTDVRTQLQPFINKVMAVVQNTSEYKNKKSIQQETTIRRK